MRITKRKKTIKQRNPLVTAALFRKAGTHKKTNKAQRRSEKISDLKIDQE